MQNSCNTQDVFPLCSTTLIYLVAMLMKAKFPFSEVFKGDLVFLFYQVI